MPPHIFIMSTTMAKHSKYYYEYDRNDLDRKNPFDDNMPPWGHSDMEALGASYYKTYAQNQDVFYPTDHPSQEFWHEDGIEFVGNPDGITTTFDFTMESEDKIDLNLDQLSNNGFWKYEEDLTMKQVREYLSETYRSHYVSKESKTQTLDLVEAIGDAEPFCRSNAIKYLSRFGKKNGKSKGDILKAIHYCILLYHFSGLHNETKGTYETF